MGVSPGSSAAKPGANARRLMTVCIKLRFEKRPDARWGKSKLEVIALGSVRLIALKLGDFDVFLAALVAFEITRAHAQRFVFFMNRILHVLRRPAFGVFE